MKDLKQENFDFFNENLENYLKDEKMKFKFLVIHNKDVVQHFDTFEMAIQFASTHLPLDEFIIQQVIGKDEQINFIKYAS